MFFPGSAEIELGSRRAALYHSTRPHVVLELGDVFTSILDVRIVAMVDESSS